MTEPTGSAPTADKPADEDLRRPSAADPVARGPTQDTVTPSIFASLRDALDDLAERASPTVREIGARAAEMTAIAADKAAPAVRKAGDIASDASGKLAVRSRDWAAEVRASIPADEGKAPDVAGAAHDATDAATDARTTWPTRPPMPPGTSPMPRPRPSSTPQADRLDMSVRPIVMLGDPRLRLKGKPVDSFGKYLHELLDDLAHTMRDAPGVGLAAPQLGEAMQACVIEVESQLYELVNPKIIRSTGDDRDLEGCLSIPGYVAYVTRRERVWVVAQDRQGRKIKVAGSGLLGRALQHELDHLDGKLYIDYLDSMDELLPVGVGDEDDAEIREATSSLA